MRRATDRLERSTGAHLAQPGNPLAASLDVVFPVLHGTFGEDGTIQGLFELADIAYVGSGVLGSSAAMDKDAMKRLFAAAGLPQTPHVALLRSQWRADPKRATRLIEKSLRYPLFVKPANLGSSVGISKVHARSELAAAINLAARFDRKLIVEQGVGGPGVKPREFEVAVLGNDEPQASVVGEIVPNKEFYDYDSKYADSPEDPSIPIIPAKLTRLRVEAGPRDGAGRLPRLRLRRPGPRRLPHGAGDQRQQQASQRQGKKKIQASHLSQRDQHHARIHQHFDVSQALAGQRYLLQEADRPPDRARPRAAPREAEDALHRSPDPPSQRRPARSKIGTGRSSQSHQPQGASC